jgi:hypothetical protein
VKSCRRDACDHKDATFSLRQTKNSYARQTQSSLEQAGAEEEPAHEVDSEKQREGESRGETRRPEVSEPRRQHERREKAAQRPIDVEEEERAKSKKRAQR